VTGQLSQFLASFSLFLPRNTQWNGGKTVRPDFCDLELLDEITKLEFHSQLVPEINGHCRNTLIRQFHTWKGPNYMPENFHPTIKWSAQQPHPLEVESQNIEWQIVDQKKNLNSNLESTISKAPNSFVTAKGSLPVQHKIVEHTSTKHKADNQDEPHRIKKLKLSHDLSKDTAKRKNENDSDRPNKKQRLTAFGEDDAPPGSQLDGEHYSCAYDALFTILFSICVSKSKKWRKIFKDSNQYLSTLHDGFQKYLSGVCNLETGRDTVHILLHDHDPIPIRAQRLQWLCIGYTDILSCIQSTTIAPQMFSLQPYHHN